MRLWLRECTAKKMSMHNKNLGLVLEGGGVKGAYQVGAMMALRELGIDFDGIAGTSIGAVNGALYLEGGYARLFDVWSEIKTNTIFDLTDEQVQELKGLDVRPAVFRYVLENRLKTIKMLEGSYEKSQEFFEGVVSEKNIRASQKDYGLVTFNLTDMEPVERMMSQIEGGKLVDFIIASATFPIFPAKVIDGKKYIDGGVYDNMPINLLVRDGYKHILVIRTNTDEKQPRRKVEGEPELFFITPKEDLGPAMAFSQRRIHTYIEMGYDDTKALFDSGLKQFLLGENI